MTNRTWNSSQTQIVTTTFGQCTVGVTDYGHAIGGNWSSPSAPADEPHSYSKQFIKRIHPLVDCKRTVRVFDHWVREPGKPKYPVYRDETQTARGTVDVFCSTSYPAGWPPNVESILDARLAAKIRGAASSLLVTAGEAGETIYMLRDAIRRITGFCWSLYKKQWRKAAGYLFPRVPYRMRHYYARKMRKLYRANTHRVSYAKTLLEFEFGWRPLVADISSLQDTLTSLLFKTRPVKVKAKKRTWFELTPSGATLATNRGERVDRKTLWIEAAITPMSQVGITFPDLMTAMYNLIPFSFVVDWALNLSSYLDTWAAKQLVKPIGTQRSYKESYVVSGYTYSGPKGYDRWYFVEDGGTCIESLQYERSKFVPGWALSFPPLTPEKFLSLRHLTDTLALCRERFRYITFKN